MAIAYVVKGSSVGTPGRIRGCDPDQQTGHAGSDAVAFWPLHHVRTRLGPPFGCRGLAGILSSR
jgi:hypothetical protein